MLLPYNSPPPKATNRLATAHQGGTGRSSSSHNLYGRGGNPTPVRNTTAKSSPSSSSPQHSPHQSTNRLPNTYGQGRYSPDHTAAKRKKQAMVVLAVLGTLAGGLVIAMLSPKQQAYPFGKPAENVKLPVDIAQVHVLYSTAVPSVGAKAIQDMLIAHALAYNENKKYGGACGSINAAIKTQNEALITALGLASELRYACPPADGVDAADAKVLTSDQYEYLDWRDTELLTPKWIRLLQRKIHYPPTKSKIVRQIVAHVQRGDVSPCIVEYVRYLPNNHYQLLIQEYTSTLRNQNKNVAINVSIISESPSFESLQNFTASGYHVHLDQPIIDDWLDMISADVLIMSRSSYSFVPAIFNRNTVVYTHYWHEPLPQWKIVAPAILHQSGLVTMELRKQKCSSNITLVSDSQRNSNTTTATDDGLPEGSTGV